MEKTSKILKTLKQKVVNQKTEKHNQKIKKLVTLQEIHKTNLENRLKQERKALEHQRKVVRERVLRYRSGLSEEQKMEKRRKDRERYRANKQKGLIKSIKELPKEEQEARRKVWQKASQKYRVHTNFKKEVKEFLDNAMLSEGICQEDFGS